MSTEPGAFHRTNRVKHPTYDTARADMFDYIERFHNLRMRRRLARQDLKFASFSEPSAEMGRTHLIHRTGLLIPHLLENATCTAIHCGQPAAAPVL